MDKKYIPIALIIVYAALLIGYFFAFNGGISYKNENWGTFGDFFGGSLSPLVGIISIYLTYVIINNQIKDNNHNDFKHTFEILYNSLETKKQQIIKYSLEKNTTANNVDNSHNSKLLSDQNQFLKEFNTTLITVLNRDIEAVAKYLLEDKDYKSNKQRLKRAYKDTLLETNESPLPYIISVKTCLDFIEKDCMKNRRNIYRDVLFSNMTKEDIRFIYYSLIHFDADYLTENIHLFKFLHAEISEEPSDFKLKSSGPNTIKLQNKKSKYQNGQLVEFKDHQDRRNYVGRIKSIIHSNTDTLSKFSYILDGVNFGQRAISQGNSGFKDGICVIEQSIIRSLEEISVDFLLKNGWMLSNNPKHPKDFYFKNKYPIGINHDKLKNEFWVYNIRTQNSHLDIMDSLTNEKEYDDLIIPILKEIKKLNK